VKRGFCGVNRGEHGRHPLDLVIGHRSHITLLDLSAPFWFICKMNAFDDHHQDL
jgi:hypothetical protein